MRFAACFAYLVKGIFLYTSTKSWRGYSYFDSTVSIGGRPLCNLRFADDIDLIGGDEEELQDLMTRLEESAGKFGMEISEEKSKVLVNSNKDTPQTHIIMNRMVKH